MVIDLIRDDRQTVLVTGCSPGGIGEQLALEFHSKGYRVFATARQNSTIDKLADLGIETLSLEVHKPDSIKKLRKEIASRTGGKLDFLVNNAGRNYTVPALEVDFEEVENLFRVNLFAIMMMVQEFGELLMRAQGKIVMIGSLSSVIPHVFGSAYNASKAALEQYSNTLRLEMEPLGVQVVVIKTGGVKSRIARTKRTLPEGSVYSAIAEEYEKRVTHSQENAMDTAKYARSVVRQVTVKNPKRTIWEGGSVWIVWIITTFFTRAYLDHIFMKMFGLYKLQKPVFES